MVLTGQTMFPKPQVNQPDYNSAFVRKKINDEKDVTYFKTKSPAYRNILTYVDLLCERIHGSGNKVFNHKYVIQNQKINKCSVFLNELINYCDQTDLHLARSAATLRFGHVAFRDWFDKMKEACKVFVNDLASDKDEQYKEELLTYLSESFGNKMRIDYGTGHELNFIVFTMGMCNLVDLPHGDGGDSPITGEKLKPYVEKYGWDIHSLFAHKYLRLCRRLQTKFRLEPAGSRGVYNMDDFQFLPFLFGAAQVTGIKHITTREFHNIDQVEQYKDDYIFFEALDFILNNKRGPFNEHSYTLWGFTNLGTWDNIFRRIRAKFTDDIMGPFPIVQHFLFGKYVLRWSSEGEDEDRERGK